MTTIATDDLKERLASCPVCKRDVFADAYAVRRRGDWYHLGCAIEHDEREGVPSGVPSEDAAYTGC